MPWEETENFIRSGHRNPDDFVDIKMIWQSEEKGIKAFGGKLKSDPDGPVVEQTILFDNKKWTMDRAKEWFAAHYLKEAVFEESFSWMDGFKVVRGKNQIKGTALNAGRTRNRNLYTEDELMRSARTLIGKPLLVNHDWNREVGEVLDAEYEDEKIEYVAEVADSAVMEEIRKRTIKYCSPKGEFRTRDITREGQQLFGMVFVELSLIEPPEKPGDSDTSVMVMESFLGQKLREAPLIRKSEEEKKMEFEEAIQYAKRTSQAVLERVWTRAYINDLPDSAFATILSGGEKDEQGKTTPRSLRKFPHHTAEGGLDVRHLGNANARVPQAKIPQSAKDEAERHLTGHKKEAKIGQFAEQLVESNPIDQLADYLEEVEERLSEVEDRVASMNVESHEVMEMAEKKKEEQPPPSPPAAQPPAQPPAAPPPAQPDLSAVAEQLRKREEDLNRREAELKAKEEALKPPEPPKEPPKGMGVIQVEKPQLTEKEKEIIKQILIRETPLSEIVQQVKKGGKVSLLSLKVGVTPRMRKK